MSRNTRIIREKIQQIAKAQGREPEPADFDRVTPDNISASKRDRWYAAMREFFRWKE